MSVEVEKFETEKTDEGTRVVFGKEPEQKTTSDQDGSGDGGDGKPDVEGDNREGQAEGQEAFQTVTRVTDEEDSTGDEDDNGGEGDKVQKPDAKDETVPSLAPEDKELLDTVKNIDGIDKLVNYLNDTGGSIEDYVRANTSYDDVNEDALLATYYERQNKHLDREDINFMVKDLAPDPDSDDEDDERRKALRRKQEIGKAKEFLNKMKEDYSFEVKAKSKLSPEEKEAVDFYSKYRSEQEESTAKAKAAQEVFKQKSDALFSEKFKGFDFQIGEEKFRYNVKDPQKVYDAQSDLETFFGTFLDDKNQLKDAAAYHKALFAAMNMDKIAQHFYEQGKADQTRVITKGSKGVDTGFRKAGNDFVDAGGTRVRVSTGDDSGRLKIKATGRFKK